MNVFDGIMTPKNKDNIRKTAAKKIYQKEEDN